MRRLILAVTVLAAAVCLALWLRPGPRPVVPVVVSRVGYWQSATLEARDAAAVVAALAALGPGRPAPPAGGVRYLLQVGRTAVTYVPGASAAEVSGRWRTLPPLVAAALRQAAAAAESSFHGALVPWDIAQHLFPLRADALIVDYATGLHFWVRRLAGSRHADVQPLTAEDTAVLKEIYGGHWSWARRPVLVEIGGHRLAASMNGMPHGAGSIPGNGFAGHFCVHFLNSEVHKTRAIDPAHLWAILTAAGVDVPRPPVPAIAPQERC